MKKIAVVIVCFNRLDTILRCIQSVLDSDFVDFDLIVVDNGSQDGSGAEIQRLYSDRLLLITNHQNAGCGAGYNTGLRYALNKGYEYVMTVDHDEMILPDALGILVDLLEKNKEIAVAYSGFAEEPGKKPTENPSFYHEKHRLNYEKYEVDVFPCKHEDSVDFILTDTLIAHATLMRTDVLRRVGLFHEKYFVYHEDTELSLRILEAGFGIALATKAFSYGMPRQQVPLVSTQNYLYYKLRNSFFMYAVHSPDWEHFCKRKFTEFFKSVYFCSMQNKRNTLKRVWFAYDDALHGNFGKLSGNRIFDTPDEDRFVGLLDGCRTVLIISNGFSVEKLAAKIRNVSDAEIVVDTDGDYDLVFQLCSHLADVKVFSDAVFVDSFLNVAITAEEKQRCLDFSKELELAFSYQYPVFVEKVRKLRADLDRTQSAEDRDILIQQLERMDRELTFSKYTYMAVSSVLSRDGSQRLREFLSEYERVAIYGAGVLGRVVFDTLVKAGITAAVLDQETEPMYEFPEVRTAESCNGADFDIVVVTPVFAENQIRQKLSSIGFGCVVSLNDILFFSRYLGVIL